MALLSKTAIGRLALSNIGGGNIESFDESSPEAKQVKLWYDIARQQTLEAHDWNFARKRIALASHGDDPPEGQWGYRYQYPADCLAARIIVNPTVPSPNTSLNPYTIGLAAQGADAVPFEIEISTDGTKSILTNLQSANLIYTFDLENPALFSMLFVQALSHCLASKIAFAITRKRALAESELQLFFGIVRNAEAMSANETVPAPPRDAEWIRGR